MLVFASGVALLLTAMRGLLVSASIGGGLALALALLSLIQSWHGRHGG